MKSRIAFALALVLGCISLGIMGCPPELDETTCPTGCICAGWDVVCME